MPADDDGVTEMSGGARPPAQVQVRAAVLAAAGMPGGCAVADLPATVAAHLGRTPTPALAERVHAGLGLLIAMGAVDEVGGRLVLGVGRAPRGDRR